METEENNIDTACQEHEHSPTGKLSVSNEDIEATVALLTAMADPARLALLLLLAQVEEACVTAIAESMQEKTNTVSMRLKKLFDAGLVVKRRDARHIYYRLRDEHIVDIVRNALLHARELRS